MTAVHQQRSNEKKTHRESEPYAVVVGTKRGLVEVVLHGLSADQAEAITTRKNREISGESSIHAIPERELNGITSPERN